MKLCIVTPFYPPDSGACAIRIGSFAKEWSMVDDVKIEVMTTVSVKMKDGNLRFHDEENISIRGSFKLAGNKRSFAVRLLSELGWSIAVLFKLLIKKYDVLFVTSPLFFPTLITVLIAKFRRKKCFADVRDLYPDVVFDLSLVRKNGVLARMLIRIEKFIYNNCEKIFTVTKGLEQKIRTRTKTPVLLSRNGVDIDLFSKTKKKVVRPSSIFNIIFHGTLGKFQDIEFILELGSKLRISGIDDIKIYVYGDGPKYGYLRSEIINKGLGEIVFSYQLIDQKNIPELLSGFRAGIAPLVESEYKKVVFPVKVYEYIASGLPVITSSNSEVGNFVEENRIGIAVGNDESGKVIDYLCCLRDQEKIGKKIAKRSGELMTEFDRKKIASMVFKEIKKSILENV